ncbi:hypothetical protein ACFSJQ_01980 [Vibrio olivae]|uniref:Transporter substrate-binding domain-containing protein n=1 Tax=Vibrio olivae TaxID=1243002 RepID=A0ABV5HL33_9VIBR
MWRAWVLGWLIGVSASISAAQEVVYPNLSGLGTGSLGYAALTLALEKSGQDYQVRFDSREVTATRMQLMLEQGEIDVMDGGYLPQVADRFDIIYRPIDMGISGWRVFIVHRDNAERLASVKTLEQLKAFVLGQGNGWNDVDILRHAGLTVITTAKLNNLISMMEVKRFDLLPLGANEAYQLLQQFTSQDSALQVDDAITLVYPFGRFFYVRKDRLKLKQAIEQGLDRALEDGSLLSLLQSHPFSRNAFERANLNQRQPIYIETPNLTKQFKAIEDKWWYHPELIE